MFVSSGSLFGMMNIFRPDSKENGMKPGTVQNPVLCRRIEAWMDDEWSPKLIVRSLADDAGADQTGRVSHETTYHALYVQTRGQLRADLDQGLLLKRRKRLTPRADRKSSSPYKEAFTISQRPAEVGDRDPG